MGGGGGRVVGCRFSYSSSHWIYLEFWIFFFLLCSLCCKSGSRLYFSQYKICTNGLLLEFLHCIMGLNNLDVFWSLNLHHTYIFFLYQYKIILGNRKHLYQFQFVNLFAFSGNVKYFYIISVSLNLYNYYSVIV